MVDIILFLLLVVEHKHLMRNIGVDKKKYEVEKKNIMIVWFLFNLRDEELKILIEANKE